MNTLFDTQPVLPQGFSYSKDFISTNEEDQLLEAIQKMQLANMQFHQYEAKRKVKSFGRGWSFTDQVLKTGDPIPEAFSFLVEKIASHLQISKESIAQFLITEYPVGSVINWHRDAPPFETIVGVSLLADCTFKLRPQEKELQTRKATISLPLSRRSVYTMSGKSKTDWQHCTMPLTHVRYSLTFRTLKDANTG